MKLRWIVLTAVIMCCTIPAVALEISDKTFTTENAGKVVFSHATHMKKKIAKSPNISCKACHNDTMKKNVRYTMAQMEQGKSCGQCHNGKKAFALAKCAACHKVKNITYTVKETGPVLFKHTAHLQKNSECVTCHNSLFKTGENPRVSMDAMEKGKSCGACHDGKKAFGLDKCMECHPVKEITIKVKETGPTPFSHKFHVEVAKCDKCHPALYSTSQPNKHVGMAAMEKGKSCGVCHNAKDAFPVKECAKCHPALELEFEDKTIGNVLFSHTFHTALYPCNDCHTSLYKAARSKVKTTMRQMEAGKSCGKCHDGKTAFTVKDTCGTCHKISSHPVR
ncbi:MAG: cytochrome c3 family protein [Desulfuromonadaceae bacterium]|nr:cytochrome c3 family protein [Desulfuromonadaceae bacterium]MDD5107266.1 cytochrome c3 family protein [Desulfuromonadaceae bacterium]